MNIAFSCPKCDATTQTEFAPVTAQLTCDHCHAGQTVEADAYHEGKLQRCLACGSAELFIRKDFSQRTGVAIIVVGFLISTVFWAYYRPWLAYGTLFVTALIDFALYLWLPNLLECYRCHAQYRGMPGLDQYEPFNLEVHEKYRQQGIRLREAARKA